MGLKRRSSRNVNSSQDKEIQYGLKFLHLLIRFMFRTKVHIFLRSIVDCLPVALPTKYFAHRLLPPSTLPTNILPMSILPMKYFACKVLLMSILPVVFCQSVWSRLYFASAYRACSGQNTGGQSTWWQSTSGNIQWAYYKLAKYDCQNLGRQNTSWAKYWQAKYDFMYLKSYIACCCVAHEVLCPPCVTT